MKNKKKKNVFKILIIAIVILLVILKNGIPYLEVKLAQDKCEKIYANKIIALPDKEEGKQGFTCTGLYWDEQEQQFLIGNAGKYRPEDEEFQATIEIVDKEFTSIQNSIPCYSQFIEMRDIQGVCKSNDNTIWLCSYGENLIRHITEDGKEIGNFDMQEPSGIAYDKRDDTLWVLTNNYLFNCTCDGEIKKTIKVHIKGQDQLFLDSEIDVLYFSAGADYHGDSYIYTVDLKSDKVSPLYVLKDSYAIEGIAIVDNILYVLNDGYYHSAETAVNQVNMYYLDDLQSNAR